MNKNSLKSMLILVTLIVLFSCNNKGKKAPSQAIYTNAQVIDLEAKEIKLRHIEVKGDIIVALHDSLPSKANIQIIDLKQQFVMPGLFDMHVHSFGNASPQTNYQWIGPQGTTAANLYAGVFGVLDLFSSEDEILAFRHQQTAQQAKLFAAGPCFTAPKGHCTEYGAKTRTIETPEDVIRELEELAPKKPDVVKVVYDHRLSALTVDKVTLTALLEQARAMDIPTVVHIGNWQDVIDSAEAGATLITHMPMTPMPGNIITTLRESGTGIIPTLTVQSELLTLEEDNDYFDHPMLQPLTTPSLREDYRVDFQSLPHIASWIKKMKEMNVVENMDTSFKTLFDAGIPVYAGTDAGNLAAVHGFAMHRELVHMVEAGLTPWQALTAASLSSQKFFNLNWDIKKGHQANFIVLKESPIDNIENTQTLTGLVKQGQWVDRAEVAAKINPNFWRKAWMFMSYPFR
jgi:imidazolonepropionase-like amidohydrolase